MKIDIKHIASLSNIPLKNDEETKLESQLASTIEHVDRLAKIDTSDVNGTNGVTDLVNVTRPDESAPSLPQDKAIQNGAHVHNGFFVVPQILEGD